MSKENVKVVRRAYELFNRYHQAKARDDKAAVEDAWEAGKTLMAPDIEYSEDPAWPGAGTYRGAERCRQVWDEYYEQFGEQVFHPEEVVDIDDRVVVILRWSARGASSGAALDMRQGHVHTLRDGQLIRWQVYFDPEEAGVAAGLSNRRTSR